MPSTKFFDSKPQDILNLDKTIQNEQTEPEHSQNDRAKLNQMFGSTSPKSPKIRKSSILQKQELDE